MANYYNVRGWRHTGFNYWNRPYSRDVFNTEWFKSTDNYFYMDGLAVKRDSVFDIRYIDLQGSVKDLVGSQYSSPNGTSSRGPDKGGTSVTQDQGPWYSWEEVDYLCLVRTGYPGDTDFIDISGNMDDPWNAPTNGKKDLRIGYYFVTGLEQRARNVTRIYLLLDAWTTCGGFSPSGLTITSGYKVRGHVSVADDAANYYTSSENIGPSTPLEVKQYKVVKNLSGNGKKLVTSSINMSKYNSVSSIDSLDAGGIDVPLIEAVDESIPTNFITPVPGFDSFQISTPGVGIYGRNSKTTEQNLSVLYSLGQLDLESSYIIPDEYTTLGSDSSAGRYASVSGTYSANPSIAPSIGGYPRKASYVYGTLTLVSMLTADQNVQPYSNITDSTVQIWSNPAPGGSPTARFKGIKDSPFILDQTVNGGTWMSNSVVLEGASGNAIADRQLSFSKSSLARDTQQQQYNYRRERESAEINQSYSNIKGGMQTVGSVGSTIGNLVTGNIGEAIDGGTKAAVSALELAQSNQMYYRDKETAEVNQGFITAAQMQKQQELAFQGNLNNLSAPTALFVPAAGLANSVPNSFVVYDVNVSDKDKERFRNYFLRYGYSGLYEKLSESNIHVKSRMNYIQTTATLLRHKYYPSRLVDECIAVLEAGVTLWDEVPSVDAIENNPDR